MADDVQIRTEPGAKIAARLCNFVTAQSDLLDSHKAWLDSNVRPVVESLPNPWIDLMGYASRLGNSNFNQQLSGQRCDAVQSYVKDYSSNLKFPMEWGKGEDESGPDEKDNSGYFRAVEIYVYGDEPAVVRPRLPTFKKLGSRQFKVRFLGGVSAGKNVFTIDLVFFEIVDTKPPQMTATFLYHGKGFAVPTFTPGSISLTGAFRPFLTKNATFLPAFIGDANLTQPPSLTAGPLGIGTDVILSLWALRLTRNHTIPHDLRLPTGAGLGITVLSGTGGRLSMVQNPKPFAGP
jgi:hypothetical protein